MTGYRAAFERLPEPLRRARREPWQRFEAAGFPDRRIERWHYTDLTALNEAVFEVAPGAPTPPLPALCGWQVQRFVNGLRAQGEPDAPAATLADDAITALNAALACDGLDWTVARGTQAAPLQLIHWTGAGAMSHVRHRVRIEAGAEAVLLIEERSDDGESLATVVTEIELGANSRLRLLRLQDLGARATSIARTQLRLGRDARLEYVGLDLGGALARHDLEVELAEPGAQVGLYGVFAPAGRTHADTQTRVCHAAPHTTSRELYRGLVMDRARAVFNGKIVVQRGAQKTDSEQHVASLLLGAGAEVNAKPELEIYADDVRCAHGASCGQLDEMAIYYLRSRGLDATAARDLLLYTFAHEVLGRIAQDDARAEFERRLSSRLPGAALTQAADLQP